MRATLRALGEARWTVLAFALAGFAVTFLQSVAYFRLAGHTLAERAAFGYSLLLEATVNAALLAPPIHPETVAGYVELRGFGSLAVVFAAWALVSATATTSQPMVPRAAAFAVSAFVAATAACIGVLAGVSSGGESVSGPGVVEAGLLLVALAMACYALCLLVVQVAPARTLAAAAVLLMLFFLNSLSRIFTGLSALRWLSPFRYYELSTPLPAGGRFDVGGLAVLLGITAAGVALAVFVSGRRSDNRMPARRFLNESSRAALLSIPVARGLYPQRVVLGAWLIAFAVLGLVLAAATRTAMQDLLALPRTLPGLTAYIFAFYARALGQTWFSVVVLMLAATVFAFVHRWKAEDRSGQVEAVLSTPYSRTALVVERMGGLAVTAAVLSIASGVAVALTSRADGLGLDTMRLAGACLLLVLFGIVLGAAGSLFTSSWPRAAPALFGGLLLAVYLDDQIGGGLGLPDWAQDLSPFRLLGTPLVDGIDGHNLALLAALVCAGVGISILLMQRRDVGTSPTRRSTYEK